MKKFLVEVTQHTYRSGFYELEAPDLEAAHILAEDIRYSDERIKWAESVPTSRKFPNVEDIYVTEAKE